MAKAPDIPDTMLAAVYYKNSDVRVQEMPVPEIGNDEVLVRVTASGVCGSDVLEWYRIKTAPRVLGHEIAAVVEKVGDNVKHVKPGDRVFVSHHVPCNTCRHCLAGQHTACKTLHTTNFDPGGFAQYVRVPKLQTDRGIFHIPDEVSDEEATFIEPLGCVVRGQRHAGMSAGKSVLVIGSGISGLLHIALAKATGAGTIMATDIHPYRMEAALKFGAKHVFSASDDVPSLVKKHNQDRGADIVFVCAGAKSAFEQGLASVEPGGVVQAFAAPPPGVDVKIPLNEFWRNAVTLMTSYGAAPNDLATAIELLKEHRLPVKDMITHKIPLKNAQRAFDLVAKAGESIKVIIVP